MLACTSPNRLVVDESSGDDNSVASLNPATMEILQLFRGDTIIVRGKKRKDTGTSSFPLWRSLVAATDPPSPPPARAP